MRTDPNVALASPVQTVETAASPTPLPACTMTERDCDRLADAIVRYVALGPPDARLAVLIDEAEAVHFVVGTDATDAGRLSMRAITAKPALPSLVGVYHRNTERTDVLRDLHHHGHGEPAKAVA